MFIEGLAPILWLIVALSVLKLPAWKACPVALIISFFMAWQFFDMPLTDVTTGILEGALMAIWPILSVIVAAIFAYTIGHPLLGDAKYTARKNSFDIKGQALHSHTLSLIHPTTAEKLFFTAPLPDDIKNILEQLRG